MAAQVADTLKKCAAKITTGKTKDRTDLCTKILIPCIQSEDFSESCAKAVIKLVFFTQHLYRDNKSRKAVEAVLEALSEKCGLAAVKGFCSVFAESGNVIKNSHPSVNTSGSALVLLKWSCIITKKVFANIDMCKDDVWIKHVECQCLAAYGVFAAANSTVCKAATTKLHSIWSKIPGIPGQYAEAISKLEASSYNLCLASLLFAYCSKSKADQEAINNYKKPILDVYLKTLVMSKIKQPTPILVQSSSVLCHASHDDFKDILLPGVQKALLRNPEVVLECVVHLVSSVSIDLSKYAMDIAKRVAGQLRAKEEIHRQQAVQVLTNLAHQCSDPTELEEIIKYLFAVLYGSEGKLSVWSDRVSVLEGIESLAGCSVSGESSLEKLASLVAEKIAPFLQQEVHAGALVTGLTVLAKWCKHFTTEVPKSLIESFRKGMGNKNSTAAVRAAFLQCMDAALKGNTLLQGLDILPILIQAVERANGQPHQTLIVQEGLIASSILIKLSLATIQADSKLSTFWTILLDAKKQVFVSEKFLSTTSEDAFRVHLTIVEKLFINHSQRLNSNNSQPWYRLLVFLMTTSSWSIRQSARSCVQKLFSHGGVNTSDLQSSLLKEFSALLSRQQVLPKHTMESLVNGDSEGDATKCISPKVLSSALLTLAFCPTSGQDDIPQEEKDKMAMHVLVDAHHPVIVSHRRELWIHICSRLGVDVKSVLEKNSEQVQDLIISGNTDPETSKHILSTVSLGSPSSLLPIIVTHLSEALDQPKYIHVTVDEYNIMNTPEGQLYDNSKLQSVKASESAKMQNMKRESKAYSYEEQKVERELQEEIKKKKKLAGKLSVRDEMSEKEKEVHDNQMKLEAETRARMLQLKGELTRMVSLMMACVESSPWAMSRFVPPTLPVLLSLLKSPLAAPIVMPLILAFRKCVFEGERLALGSLIGYVTLRLLKPQSPVDSNWTEEPLQSAVTRAVTSLHSLTTPADPEEEEEEVKLLTATAFAYCFPMLKVVLSCGGKAVDGDEDLRQTALQVVFRHCQLRSEDEEEEADESGPELLPRQEMFSLFSEIISTSSDTIKGSRLQQLASLSLVELCKSVSGEQGCTVAESDEIDVLMRCLESSAATLRFSALQGLLQMAMVLPEMDDGTSHTAKVIRRVWVARFDVDEENKALGQRLWDEVHYSPPESLSIGLLQDIVHDVDVIREAASSGLAAAVEEQPALAASIVHQLTELYEEKLKIPPPVLDDLGRVVSDPFFEPWPARAGIAQALGKLSPCLEEDQVSSLFNFFVPTGLGDRHEQVRKHMLASALKAVNDHGKANISILLPVFEGFLDIAPDSSAHDTIRQSVIILMGSLARHLDKEDPKVKPIVTKLVDALSTPSQQVQEAVANCLPPLVPAIKAEAPDLVKKLLNQLLESTVYGERKGAAYGLAGLVKGLGILYLKQLNIMSTLQDAIQNKKNFRHREGALFAFEMLCTMLGRLFEPYVVHVLPHLLLCFGDGNQYVREATDDTARAVMKNLSAHGVKLVLPSLLAALKEDSWRTKTGSVELLGAMAYCAPKQLSSCLPSIVPMLCKVLTDSHIKVQKAGAQALKMIGSVIRNPEIQAISSVLLEALMDPSNRTAPCLQVLLQTSFVHFIDAPSLALIMPVLHRALSERSTETKKMAAQIIGNMYSLTDTKDLSPYLNSVVPGLKQSLLDPVPEVRGVSARALGALVKGMGEENFEDLLPWLMETLTSENSSVDRSGAAQGLSEVLCGLGTSRLEKLMPEVISTTEKTELSPHVREGYLMLYIYLPTTFKETFTPFIGPIIPSILKGLADEVEFVRDTSLRAGQRIVNAYADTAIELLLPELERGLFDDNWRIRFSSIQLLGDLLYKISGVTGKMTTEGEEDDNFGTSQSNQKIIASLGFERRNRVLAGLYMGRSDVSLIVRQAALHVWKVVVPNTPRILREILSTLFSLLLGCLASKSFDKRQIAARTLGDLVRKLGERVLPEIIPILEEGLNSTKRDERQGVCIGLSEIIGSTSKEQVSQYVDSLVPTVRRALCDPLPEVRAAAAKTFDNLYTTIGNKALDDILPDLLAKMDDPSVSEFALDGLRQVMQIKSRVVLPFLVPKLIAPPVNSRALAILSAVADESLTRHLNKILPALLSAMQQTMGTDHHQEELEAARKLVLSVEDDAGVKTVIEELVEATKHKDPGFRKCAVLLLHTFCSETPADFSQFIPLLFRYSLHLMNDNDLDVVTSSWDVLQAVTKSLDPGDQLSYIAPLRQAIKYAADDVKGEDLPGFCLPKKGITPVLPIFREGILNGTPELKEQAAYGLGEVIKLTSAAALRPSVVNITGPLIRILGDRFSWNVKVAVLQTLGLLLGKVGAMLKPFLPQLQTTFIKALNDPNKTVRLKAASALQKLVVLHTRVDPLFTELQNGVKNTEDNTIRETQLQALRGVIAGAGQKMGEPVRKGLTTTLLSLLGHGENSIRVGAGGCLGSLAVILPDNELVGVMNDHLTVNDATVDWTLRHGNAIALSAVIHDAPQKVLACGLYDVITNTAVAHATTDRIPICSYGVRSLGFILTHSNEEPVAPKVLQTLAKDIQEGSVEVRSLAATAVKYAAKSRDGPLDQSTIKTLVPPLITSTRDKNSAVKASAELALAALLRLADGDETLQACCRELDSSTSDTLTEMARKTLRRLASQEELGIEEMTAPFNMDMG